MARKLRGTAIQSGTINITQLSTTVVNNITTGGGPKVASITYPNSATAAVNTGNQSVVLTGTGFESGVQVYVNGSAVPAVSRANANSLSFTTPVLSTGATYPLYVVNPDGGTAVFVPGMVVSAGPVWVTDTNLPSWTAASALSTTLVATSDSTVSYALDVGSSLPAGLSLAANGVLSGTLSSPPASTTTYNFTVVATDLELQKSSKAFSINATINITEATGGTVSNISGYRVHTFTSSGSFQVVSGAGTVEYLVIAGGGSGAGSYNYPRAGGGGGGAGGMRAGSGFAVSAGNTYTVTVGAGGAARASRGAPAYQAAGLNGSNSAFSSISATGGGGGGAYDDSGGFVNGRSGGSGGGGAGWTGSNAAGSGNAGGYSPAEGNNGGAGVDAPAYIGGGGGGAGAVGQNAQPNAGGAGGNGLASSITGASVTYAGGGGATTYFSGTGGVGGTGGGGAGGGAPGNPSAAGVSGTAATGSGGGAAGYGTLGSGAGGSGIVIVRYAV
jgi:hypothetical protein